jgi:hypothetical protein
MLFGSWHGTALLIPHRNKLQAIVEDRLTPQKMSNEPILLSAGSPDAGWNELANQTGKVDEDIKSLRPTPEKNCHLAPVLFITSHASLLLCDYLFHLEIFIQFLIPCNKVVGCCCRAYTAEPMPMIDYVSCLHHDAVVFFFPKPVVICICNPMNHSNCYYYSICEYT